jgi:predicted transposase YdaD
MKKDVLSKEILITIIKDISKHILKFEKDIKKIEFINSESNRVEQRRADVLAKIDDEFILHIEIQNNNDISMPYRMLRYFTDIRFLTNLPVKQYIIYIGKTPLKMKDGVYEDNINYQYTLIDMRDIDCELLIKEDTPDALVLAILCDFKDKNPKDVVKYIIDRLIYHTKNNIHKYRKYLLILEEFSKNRDLEQVVKEQEMLSEIKYEELPSYEIGLEKGLEKGMEKGMEKGIQEGKKMVAKVLLQNQSLEEVAKITGLSIEVLKELK